MNHEIRQTLRGITLSLALLTAGSLAWSQQAPPDPEQARQQIYGSQLMTEQERNEIRARMRDAGSDAERQRIRAEHHARMQERAKERGMMLPDEPPARGMGQGKGSGSGQGKGKGPGPKGS